jgi:hypothetical protein
MRKLNLDLDHLQVQSFDTMPAARNARGTVVARQSETYDEAACASPTYASCATCESCDTCDACTQTICDPTDTADPNRRIILY